MENRIPLYRRIFFSTTKYIFFKNVFFVTTGVLSIFVIRLLGPAEYGKYFLIIQIASTIGPMLALGWLPALAKHLPEYTDVSEKKKLYSSAVSTVAIAIVLFGLFFLLAGGVLDRFIPKEIRDVKNIFLLLICFMSLINVAEGMFRGMGRFTGWAILDGVRGTLAALLILGVLIFVKRDYACAVSATILIYGAFFMVIFIMEAKYLVKPDFRIKKDVLKFISVMFAGQILFLFTSTVDPVLLRWLLKDPAQVGFYSAGTRIPKLSETFFMAHLAVPFLYYFTESETVLQRKRIIENLTRILGVFFGFSSLVLFAFAEQIVPLLFSDIYAESIMVMRIYSFWIFFAGLQIFVSSFFLAVNKPAILLFAGLFFFVFNFYFDLIFIPVMYATGAAIGAILAIFTQTFLYIFLYHRYGINLSSTILVLMTGMGISVAAGALTYYPVALVVFPVFVLLTRQITEDDFRNFQSIFLKKYGPGFVPEKTISAH